MKVRYINHKAPVIIGDYPYADAFNEEVLSLLESGRYEHVGKTNVKAFIHTEWNWEPNNIKFRNLKAYIREEIERYYKPGAMITVTAKTRKRLQCYNFWGNVYKKGDYTQSHNHRPYDWSFAYFVKAKWFYSPLVFTDSEKKVRPKEGRFVAFPAFMNHHVPEHRYSNTRITVSGNYQLDKNIEE